MTKSGFVGKGLSRRAFSLHQKSADYTWTISVKSALSRPAHLRVSQTVERTAEVALQAAPLDPRTLALQRAAGIIFRWAGGRAVALRQDAGQASPGGRHGEITKRILIEISAQLPKISSKLLTFHIFAVL